jgi:hypothetical protein
MGTMVSFQRPDGQTVQGYLAQPTGTDSGAPAAPAVVVIQEWWGLNDQIRGVADRLAAAGYQALVPDLYRGQSTVEAEEANHLMEGLNFGDAASQDIRGAVQFLKTRAPKVGVTGFCMGGALTLLALTQSMRCVACPHPSPAHKPCGKPAIAAAPRAARVTAHRSARACGSRACLQPFSMRVSASASTYSTPPRARTSCRLLLSFSSKASLGATVTTGISLVTSASGPCLSSPAA